MADEQYLSPAQVADELQVTVVTVRRWIANRELRATKAGPRRWTIRRSDLDAFLADGGRAGPSVEVSEDPSFSKHLVAPMSVERAREQLELAEGRWQTAVKEHAQPPPDAGYARRLRALADAAAQEQAAYRYAEEEGFGWRRARRGCRLRNSAPRRGERRSPPRRRGSGSMRRSRR